MKKLTTILFFLAFNVTLFAQTNPDRVLGAFIDDFSEACGQDPGDVAFCLKDEKGNKITERYTIALDGGVWKVEPSDFVTKDWTLNPKYKGKGAKLYCTKNPGGAGYLVYKVEILNVAMGSTEPKIITGTLSLVQEGMANNFKIQTANGTESYANGLADYYSYARYLSGRTLKPEYEGKKFEITIGRQGTTPSVTKIRLVGEGPVAFEKDNFKGATCRAYNVNGSLICIVENNTIYRVKDGQKQEADSKQIQNKDEICMKATRCGKVKVEPDGMVSVYELPNVTDKVSSLKIVGDKICYVKKKSTEVDELKEYYLFKGNKTQAALIAIATRMGMGR